MHAAVVIQGSTCRVNNYSVADKAREVQFVARAAEHRAVSVRGHGSVDL